MKIRRLDTVEYTKFNTEKIIRQISADATIEAEEIQGVIRLTVEGPTEDFYCDCNSFSLGPTVEIGE